LPDVREPAPPGLAAAVVRLGRRIVQEGEAPDRLGPAEWAALAQQRLAAHRQDRVGHHELGAQPRVAAAAEADGDIGEPAAEVGEVARGEDAHLDRGVPSAEAGEPRHQPPRGEGRQDADLHRALGPAARPGDAARDLVQPAPHRGRQDLALAGELQAPGEAPEQRFPSSASSARMRRLTAAWVTWTSSPPG
jgi:hypothetical protein